MEQPKEPKIGHQLGAAMVKGLAERLKSVKHKRRVDLIELD